MDRGQETIGQATEQILETEAETKSETETEGESEKLNGEATEETETKQVPESEKNLNIQVSWDFTEEDRKKFYGRLFCRGLL